MMVTGSSAAFPVPKEGAMPIRDHAIDGWTRTAGQRHRDALDVIVHADDIGDSVSGCA